MFWTFIQFLRTWLQGSLKGVLIDFWKTAPYKQQIHFTAAVQWSNSQIPIATNEAPCESVHQAGYSAPDFDHSCSVTTW